MATFSAFLAVTLACLCLSGAQANFHFSPNVVYSYQFEGTIDMQNVLGIQVDAELEILTSDSPGSKPQYCRLEVTNYRLISTEARPVYMGNIDLARWIFFDLNSHGEMTRVYWSKEEDKEAVNLKKQLLATLASKLMISQELTDKQEAWAYRVNETGSEGEHESEYQALPGEDGIVFTKTRLTQALPGSDHQHTKTIHYHHSMHVPKKVTVKEMFRHRDPSSEEDGDHRSGQTTESMPSLFASSEAEMTLLGTDRLTEAEVEDEIASYPDKDTLEQGTLEVEQVTQLVPLETIEQNIIGNISCAANTDIKRTRKWVPCFQNVKTSLQELSYEDISKLLKSYLQDHVSMKHKQVIVDALGAAATMDTQRVLVEQVLLAETPSEDLVMRSMVHFAGMDMRPAQVVAETLEKMALTRPMSFSDKKTDQQVQNRAILVLGAIAGLMYEYNPEWSLKVITELENNLGIHDPWNHQQRKEQLTAEDFQVFNDHKSIWLLALGNAAFDTSYEHIMSYLNTSDSHVLYKCSAVQALSQYGHERAATDLLRVGLTNHELTVRRNALKRYKRHDFGGPIDALLNSSHPSHGNITEEAEHRMRRSLRFISAPGWGGFGKRLRAPEIGWFDKLGDPGLGGSLGVDMNNILDIDINPLASSFGIDLESGVWSTVHAKSVDIRNHDFFFGDLCAKLDADFDVNLLKEFGYDEISDLANLFDGRVKEITNVLKDSLEGFRELVDKYKGKDIEDIIKEVVAATTDLPDLVSNLIEVVQRIQSTIGSLGVLFSREFANWRKCVTFRMVH